MNYQVGKDYYNNKLGRNVTIIEFISDEIVNVYTGNDFTEVHISDLVPERTQCSQAKAQPTTNRNNPFGSKPAERYVETYETRAQEPIKVRTPDNYMPVAEPIRYAAPKQERTFVSTKSIKNNNIKDGRFNMNIKRIFGEFGRVNNGEVVLTFDGKVAVRRNADEYVRYDAEKEQIVNHMNLVMDGASKFFYVLPVTAVAEGDVIVFKNAYYQVLKINQNGALRAVNLKSGTISNICKETNVFNINFYYKVTSLLGNNGEAREGLNPMMLMMLKKDDKFEDLLPLMMLTGQGFEGAEGFNNPLLLMTIMKEEGSDMKDIMMLQAMMGQGGNANLMSNPMMLMMLMDKGDTDMKDIMMMQMMSGQTAEGSANPMNNPMMLMMMMDKEGSDMKDMFMMQAMMGAQGTEGAANPMSNPMLMMMLMDK